MLRKRCRYTLTNEFLIKLCFLITLISLIKNTLINISKMLVNHVCVWGGGGYLVNLVGT